HRRNFEIGRVRVPDAAEIDLLVLELLHLDDLRESLDPVDERILDRLAPGAREHHELPGGERLIAKEKHEVLEPGAPQLADLLRRKRPRKINAEDLGAKCARDAPD